MSFQVTKLWGNTLCNNRYINYASHREFMNKSGKDPLKAVVLKSYTANPCLTKDKHPDIKNFVRYIFSAKNINNNKAVLKVSSITKSAYC